VPTDTSGSGIRAPSIRMVTPSFRGDLERCAALCRSFDDFADPAFRHQVIVPRRDLKRFRGLAGRRREVLCVEEVLPARAFRLPARRERFLLAWRHARKGWLVQQLVKLAAAREGGVDAVVLADSDIVLVRPLAPGHFLRGGRVRLYRADGTGHYRLDPNYPKWHRGAARLLGVDVEEPYPANFIGPLASWAPDVVRALCARIEAVAGRPWVEAVAGLPAGAGFSEYTTYGLFSDLVDAAARARHAAAGQALCHLSWEHAVDTPAGREAFVRALRAEHVAVLIQSNLHLPPSDWRALLKALPAGAAADAA